MNIRLVPIGDFVEPVQTWNPAAIPYSTFNYVDLSAIDQIEKQIKFAVPVRGSEVPSRARQLIRTGDILVSTVRPNLNGAAPVTDTFDGATASTGFCVLRPRSERLSSNYLMHWVRSPLFVDRMVREATGASYPAISDRIIKASHIPLPPIDEQWRIAAILDRADALRRKRRFAGKLLDSLTQSIFVAMFGDERSSPYGIKILDAITDKITDGAHFTPTYVDSGVPFLRVTDIQDETIDWQSVKYIPEEEHENLIL